MSDRVVATGVVPYPPGIPLLMPGESAGPPGGAVLLYLQALEDWDQLFPRFEHETHEWITWVGDIMCRAFKSSKGRGSTR
jgi:arginine/lysine/ornithine decarboxylase